MGCNGSKSCDHCRIDGSCVVKERAGEFLYNFFVCWCQERVAARIRGVLCFCPVAGLDVGVRPILRFLWMFVVENFDGICDIFEHGDLDDSPLLTPADKKFVQEVNKPTPMKTQ